MNWKLTITHSFCQDLHSSSAARFNKVLEDLKFTSHLVKVKKGRKKVWKSNAMTAENAVDQMRRLLESTTRSRYRVHDLLALCIKLEPEYPSLIAKD
jgi:hypothetical protein